LIAVWAAPGENRAGGIVKTIFFIWLFAGLRGQPVQLRPLPSYIILGEHASISDYQYGDAMTGAKTCAPFPKDTK
jgi:hypothetical protein